MSHRSLLLLAIALPLGCAEDDPRETPFPDGGAPDAGDGGLCDDNEFPGGGDNSSCTPLADDYSPGVTDSWDSCISDDGEYHPFEINISTVARVGAFERIADLLFGRPPSASDFIEARLIYAEEQGLESRVSRREDEHYPAAPSACRDLTPAEQADYPERCVGPVLIQPLLNDAFASGANGDDLRINAARIEAALLWFLYVSVYKEATTCTETARDCDSSWAYYTGGAEQDSGLGLARYTRDRSVQAHDRVWDGLLAVRCWRDLDNPTGTAMDLALRDRALAQLDRALLRGVALIVRARLAELANACPGDADAVWSFLQVLGPVLDREAEERDAADAALLRTEFSRSDPATVDVAAAIGTLDDTFPCP